jgi:rfaE bifunctional protein nucleotidyltransferase chain/domain
MLAKAAHMGASLIVAVNTDASVARLKGEGRPVQPLEDRMAVLIGLASVSAVVAFGEDTPIEVIRRIKPEILVKGGDWMAEDVAGADEVLHWGGVFRSIPIIFQRSTTEIIEKIQRTMIHR